MKVLLFPPSSLAPAPLHIFPVGSHPRDPSREMPTVPEGGKVNHPALHHTTQHYISKYNNVQN